MLVPAQDNWWESTTMPFSTLRARSPPASSSGRSATTSSGSSPFKYVSAEGREIPVTAEPSAIRTWPRSRASSGGSRVVTAGTRPLPSCMTS